MLNVINVAGGIFGTVEVNNMVKIKLSEIEKDSEIYPRQQISHKTIESYVEAIKAGATFPPITVQKISVNGETKVICLDGWHRLEAYREYNKLNSVTPIDEVEVNYWKEGILDKQSSLNELRLESAFRNILHGDRLSMADREFQARRIVEANPKIENKILAEKFGVTEWTITQWVKDIRARFYASRNALIYRLYLLGYTQQEIGELFNLKQRTISDIVGDSGEFSQLKTTLKVEFNSGKPIEEIAKYHQLDLPLAYAIILDGKTDLERFELFGTSEYQNQSPIYYNVWNFSKRDKRLGVEHPMNIAGQIVMNILYFYTEQKDKVLDPMAGGGSTIDACLVMGRECKAYDKEPCRQDIKKNFINVEECLKENKPIVPENMKKFNLVFLDPEYYNMVASSYNNINDFYNFISGLAKCLFRDLKDGTKVALLMQDMTEKGKYFLSYECSKRFFEIGENVGFKYLDHISVPTSTEQYLPQQLERAKKEKRLLGRNRDLIIMIK